MKKRFVFSALIAFALVSVLVSCNSDDDNLPQVNLEVTISGGVQNEDDNKIYIQQGTPLVVDSITVESLTGKRATLGLTTYYLNGLPQFQTITKPFRAEFDTSVLSLGEYIFQIKTSVYQIDKSPAFALLSYVLVVEEADDETTDTPGSSVVFPTEQQLAEQ